MPEPRREVFTENALSFIDAAFMPRPEVVRILRKSRDFRQDHEVKSTWHSQSIHCLLLFQLEYIASKLGHIPFPMFVRMPGINPQDEVRKPW